MSLYCNCGQDHRDSVLDIDNCEQDNTTRKRTVVDYKISDDSSMSMIGKIGASDNHGDTEKKVKMKTPWEEVLPEYKWDLEPIPNLQEMPLSCLKYPYTPGTAFWLRVPEATAADGVVYARETMKEVYQMFQLMAPALSFSPSIKKMKCKGSYTQNYSSCIWETQIWRVHPSVARSKKPKNEYIFECRRKSKGGRDAFSRLVGLIGMFLKDNGRASKYANGCWIFPPVAPIVDMGNLGMRGIGSPLDDFLMMPIGNSHSLESSEYPINLDKDCVERMAVDISEGRYPQCHENMALLAQCAVDPENLEVMQESSELKEAVHQELMKSTQLSTCVNALILMDHGVASPKEGLIAAARSLMVHSGYKGSGLKGLRSRAVEYKALHVMSKLASQLGKEREKMLLEIENDIRGKVSHEAFRKVQDIRTGH